jgi:putative ATP-binding cassette transporter
MKQLWKMVFPILGKWGLIKYVLAGIFTGFCSFLFIQTVTSVLSLIMSGSFTQISKEYLLAFAAIILLFVWTRRMLSLGIIHLSQNLFWKLRKQILLLMLGAGYPQLSERKTRIYAVMVNDVNVLTQASLNIIDFFTGTVLAVSCLIYLSFISFVLFLITLGVCVLGVIIYHFGNKRNRMNFLGARMLEDRFVKHFNGMLNGFKEIFMEPRKGKAIYEQQMSAIAEEAYDSNTRAFTGFLNNQITGQIFFYLLISSILLFFSIALHIKAGSIVSFVFTLLYLLNAIEMVMVILPNLTRASVSAGRLTDLKSELENMSTTNTSVTNYMHKDKFEQLRVSALEFSYSDPARRFGIGPVDFEVNKGDVIFIYGGNGSGKTTFINTLLGLFTPTAGEILLNGSPVTEEDYKDYRTCFGVVFSDFYLFEELLGLEVIDKMKWEYYLRIFELEDKVKLEGRSFSTTDLSTGQRKRLALIATLMEEKPVLVLDEWAADQDPAFRKKFYTEIIPLIKQEGTTIIAITHDDKYYHCAEKIYKMDYGKLVEENADITEYVPGIVAKGKV